MCVLGTNALSHLIRPTLAVVTVDETVVDTDVVIEVVPDDVAVVVLDDVSVLETVLEAVLVTVDVSELLCVLDTS